ncbi:polysaccharide deacetylase family protein [Paenibacillus ferrarius]|nr:polysaccharide deacetylase family protein [Paenibacillus ferrarius]
MPMMLKRLRLATSTKIATIAAIILASVACFTHATAYAAETHGIQIPVLNYHSIGVESGNTYVLPPDEFARQMAYLAAQHYTPLTLGDFVRIIEKKQPSPPKPVLLTFDDGYANNAEVALPILQRYGFPATLFLSTGAVGQPGYLSWPQVQELSAAGWDIAPHGITHPHLPKVSREQQREELAESRQVIEHELGKRVDVFAYPYGEYNADTLKLLSELGYRYAFTIQEGWASSNQSPYKLRRLVVHEEESLEDWIQRLQRAEDKTARLKKVMS